MTSFQNILKSASNQGFLPLEQGGPQNSLNHSSTVNISPWICIHTENSRDAEGNNCLVPFALICLSFSFLVIAAKSLATAGEASEHYSNGEILKRDNVIAPQKKTIAKRVNQIMLINRSVHSIGEMGCALGVAMAIAALSYSIIYLKNPQTGQKFWVKARQWWIRGGLVIFSATSLLAVNQFFWLSTKNEFQQSCNALKG